MTNSSLPIVLTTYLLWHLPNPLDDRFQLHPSHQLQPQDRVSASRLSVPHLDVMDQDIKLRVGGLKGTKQEQDAQDINY